MADLQHARLAILLGSLAFADASVVWFSEGFYSLRHLGMMQRVCCPRPLRAVGSRGAGTEVSWVARDGFLGVDCRCSRED